MRFSIRFLLVVTLLVALVIQARMSRRKVISLEGELAGHKSRYERLENQAAGIRPQAGLCRAVWDDFEFTSDHFLKVRQRFIQLQQGRAAE